ncbi:hypothetical protein jhhlp_002551 [Lomentospora prolificans]|uniref:tRNA pseudouridine(55) synthase n=1 Tax=Lomentospora prolificans TaxID=41688 RepID=A0A2N3NEA8_9PEZI|nr:hypothetical protein jhhlp_002547 [Lomentospora prolificans]PKS10794.1 hypothetical protein jhhlp_002551 [Lomentospora prolificans]
MAKDAILDGVFAINKPVGVSSAQVIRDCQTQFNPSAFFAPMISHEKEKRMAEGSKAFNRRSRNKKELRVKMGHGGTLDPLASGVLILGVGSGTKSLQSFLDCTKTYETVVVFGASTDTYDRVGRILTRRDYSHITKNMVLEAMESFRGRIKQVPPLYSALKMEGKPLYEYAREGKPIPREIPTREVEVQSLELVDWYDPGSHRHFWPTEEADDVERQFAEKVWKQQETSKSMTPEEEKEEAEALAAHEAVKRKFESDVDGLVKDRPPSKRQKKANKPQPKADSSAGPMMSGALGQTPSVDNSKKGSNLIPPTDPDASAPWDGPGPPAAKIRMTVTSGFYVRSFCHDLGAKVNSAAMMAELCRSRQGDFEVGGPTCMEYSDVEKGEDVWAPKVAAMLAHWAQRGNAPADAAPLVVDPVQVASEAVADEAKASNGHEPASVRPPPDAETVPQSVEPEAAVQTSAANGAGAATLEVPTKKEDDEVSWNGFQD